MRKEFAIKTLKRIKDIQGKIRKLNELGVDITELDNGVELLEESIALLFTSNKKDFESVLELVQWWLYEDVEKYIYFVTTDKLDVRTVGSFINYIIETYDNERGY